MGLDTAVMVAKIRQQPLASSSVENSISFNSSSRSRPIKTPTYAFCCDLLGWM